MIKKLCFALLPLSLMACNDEAFEEAQNDTLFLNDGIESVDGVLHFESTDAFFRFVDYVVNLSEDERKRVEESLGFTSMQSYVEELERAYGEEPMLANIYPTAFACEDSVSVRIVPHFYSCVADIDGFYCIDNVMHRVNGSEVAFLANGSQEELVSMLGGFTTDESVNHGILCYKNSCLKSSLDGKTYESVLNLGIKNLSSNYRMRHSITLYVGTIGTQTSTLQQYWVEQKIKNERKHKPFNNWKDFHCYTYIGFAYFSLDGEFPIEYDQYDNIVTYAGLGSVGTIDGYTSYGHTDNANIYRNVAISERVPRVLPKRTFSRYYVRTTNSEFNNRKTTTFKTVEFMSGDWSDNLRVISNYVFPNL